MPFQERINYASFNENKNHIESDWDVSFGDRKIELVFIGQHLDKEGITSQLQQCLLTDIEIEIWKGKDFPEIDQWPIAKQN